ncbi:MAG: hypothetical protein JW881_06900 [Spirochaetales bacterium]|nr:hypothetical protein [Spirochaetales bacterium]
MENIINGTRSIAPDSRQVADFERRITENPVISFDEEGPPPNEASPLMKLLYTCHRDAYVLIDRTRSILEREEKSGGSGILTQSVRTFIDFLPSPETMLQQSPGLLTAVHEINHGYTRLYASNVIPHQHMPAASRRYMCYFLTREKTAVIRVSNADETPRYAMLETVIPAELRTKRFDTYVAGDEGSKSGVYTLLDEYNAYFQSFRTAFSLVPYFKKERPRDDGNWLTWAGKLYSDYFAYFEFRYWILTYLLHLRRIDQPRFEAVIKTKGFRMAFSWIDSEYSKLAASFDDTVTDLVSFVLREGGEAGYESAGDDDPWKGMLLTIGGSGIEMDMIERDLLAPLFERPEYKELLDILHDRTG